MGKLCIKIDANKTDTKIDAHKRIQKITKFVSSVEYDPL